MILSEIIQTYDFEIFENETVASLRYPMLSDGAYIFSLFVDSERFNIEVRYNIFSESPNISILDSENENIAVNQNMAENINFLINDDRFSGYILYFDKDKNKFIFGKN